MDRLPNFKHATIDTKKLREYCLNAEHPVGKHKARVFKSVLGLQKDDAELLKKLILKSLPDAQANISFRDKYGVRYTVDIKIRILGKIATLTTGWIIKAKEDFPRLITCYIKNKP